jgi:hypothetical protein
MFITKSKDRNTKLFAPALRDYFAAQALVGVILHPDTELSSMAEDATWAYEYADAMMEARAR